jgi:hypothetical protein
MVVGALSDGETEGGLNVGEKVDVGESVGLVVTGSVGELEPQVNGWTTSFRMP